MNTVPQVRMIRQRQGKAGGDYPIKSTITPHTKRNPLQMYMPTARRPL